MQKINKTKFHEIPVYHGIQLLDISYGEESKLLYNFKRAYMERRVSFGSVAL